MRILFMGTPEFAVPCLRVLVDEGYDVAGAVTQPDKPKGRGHKMAPPPVKEYALEKSIPVYQPVKLKNNEFLDDLQHINPDLIVVVAYGKILPSYILEYPKYGCINVHASLLPKYRGAGPIQWSIINGEKETGITTMYMEIGLDTGDMILKRALTIGEYETAGELHDRLSVLGAEVLKETVKLIKENAAPREPQLNDAATYAPMLDKAISKIDWNKSAVEIKNLVRGVNPWPVAYSQYQGQTMKVWSVEIGDDCKKSTPGTIVDYIKGKGLAVQAGGGQCILIKELQFTGGKRMTVDHYLLGHSIQIGERLE
ncbi:methionyl-tRNA formyltransferase [Petroclostridium sp. X23]|uniref:methionyl-tRNA formyltransferase n=1 Tax=Petroclostridium sp. X23 TaxID=3045146 RepID=UPI0024AC880D|nr:methionyl-tRNA formyltransferase [Petroclostridium sp. X23]WHH59899.1 methionyl-tRNA formyltransferase [Petroclostridium sp. X23]